LKVTKFWKVNELSEEKVVSVIRDFVEAYVKGDVEKTLSFLTEDVVWVQPEGTFKGKEEVKRLLTWLPNSFWYSQLKVRDAGVGILVKGNKAVYEQTIEGVSAHSRTYEAPAISIFEFSGEKIQQYRALCDRMTLGKQGCGKQGYGGWLDRKILAGILNTWEGGLH
jgi:ketosteroid isomerase-like protein